MVPDWKIEIHSVEYAVNCCVAGGKLTSYRSGLGTVRKCSEEQWLLVWNCRTHSGAISVISGNRWASTRIKLDSRNTLVWQQSGKKFRELVSICLPVNSFVPRNPRTREPFQWFPWNFMLGRCTEACHITPSAVNTYHHLWTRYMNNNCDSEGISSING